MIICDLEHLNNIAELPNVKGGFFSGIDIFSYLATSGYKFDTVVLAEDKAGHQSLAVTGHNPETRSIVAFAYSSYNF